MALRSGHPVYFVVFFPDPEPGQTLLDVCAAEAAFVHKVREPHPESAKPAPWETAEARQRGAALVVDKPVRLAELRLDLHRLVGTGVS